MMMEEVIVFWALGSLTSINELDLKTKGITFTVFMRTNPEFENVLTNVIRLGIIGLCSCFGWLLSTFIQERQLETKEASNTNFNPGQRQNIDEHRLFLIKKKWKWRNHEEIPTYVIGR